MKKVFALILSVILLFSCSVATADVLSSDWQSASDDELAAAVSAINAELAARKAASVPAGDVITLTGSGTAIESIEIPFQPARVTIESDKPITAKLTGRFDTDFDGSYSGFAQELIGETGKYTCLINGDGAWTLTVEPMTMIGAVPALSGSKSTISDGFTLNDPVIVHVKAGQNTGDGFGYFSVYLYYHDEYGWSRATSYSIHEFLIGSNTIDKDLILQPYAYSNPDMYALYVFDDIGVEWSIEVK